MAVTRVTVKQAVTVPVSGRATCAGDKFRLIIIILFLFLFSFSFTTTLQINVVFKMCYYISVHKTKQNI